VKLSIITIHLNELAGLERTFNSLAPVAAEQSLEWIVIDGGSKLEGADIGVIDRVKSLADHFASEPDEGIYDAMNKGTRLVVGDYVLYLNAGDELHPEFNLQAIEGLTQTAPAMIWGRCQERYENGSLIQVKTRSPSWAWYGMPVSHQAIFFRRDILGDTPYDSSFQIAADYDLVCRLLCSGAEVQQLDSVVSIFHRGGLSHISGDVSREEENQVRLKYFHVPVFAGKAIKNFKGMNARLAKIAWLRRLWRRWI